MNVSTAMHYSCCDQTSYWEAKTILYYLEGESQNSSRLFFGNIPQRGHFSIGCLGKMNPFAIRKMSSWVIHKLKWVRFAMGVTPDEIAQMMLVDEALFLRQSQSSSHPTGVWEDSCDVSERFCYIFKTAWKNQTRQVLSIQKHDSILPLQHPAA